MGRAKLCQETILCSSRRILRSPMPNEHSVKQSLVSTIAERNGHAKYESTRLTQRTPKNAPHISMISHFPIDFCLYFKARPTARSLFV